MAVSQLVLFYDGISFRAEMPGSNGSRRKITLPNTFERRNPELVELLQSDLKRIADQTAKLAEIRAAEQTRQHTQIIDQRAALQAQLDEQARKRREWLETLPKDRQEIERQKIQTKLERAAEQANSRARGLYYYVVEHHSLKLAERVIEDPKRRPRKKIMVSTADGMREMNPSTGVVTTKGKTTLSLADLNLAVEI